jgi:hypothetical protein
LEIAVVLQPAVGAAVGELGFEAVIAEEAQLVAAAQVRGGEAGREAIIQEARGHIGRVWCASAASL